MKVAGLLLLGAVISFSYWASQAEALPQFKAAFQKKYVDNSTDPAFKAAFKKESCNVCHVKGKEKTERNDYGQALSKFLGGNVKKDYDAAKKSGGNAAANAVVNKAVKALMDEGFDKVAEEKSPSGKTFGDLIKDGKLPASK